MRRFTLTRPPLFQRAAVVLLVFFLQVASGHHSHAQSYYLDTKEGKQRWLDARKTIQTEREKEIGSRDNKLRSLETDARAHADELSVIGCTTASIDKWWATLSEINNLMAKIAKVHVEIAEDDRNKARTFPYPYNETFSSAAIEDLEYVNGYARFVAEYMDSQVAARLTFVDTALRRGCVDLADAEYRKVLQLQHRGAKFSSRAMVGIQDVRDARARLATSPTTAPNVEICTNGKPRHWSQSLESCRSQ